MTLARRLWRHGVPSLCLLAFLAVWVALAISPRSREDWLLENVLTFVAVPLLVATYPRFRFGDRAYVQGAIFLVLHTIGSHYTYSEVPLGEWARSAFDLSRNHYDRLVHFLAGVLLLRAVREAFFRRHPLPRARELFLSWTVVAACSLLYEVLEWCTAIVVDPAAGAAYLGTQGDPWDAQKDMALACTGAIVAMAMELRAQPLRADAGAAPPGRGDRS